MAVKKREEKVGEALLKVALGCRVEEVTEEYAEVDGELKLTKRRETKKDIPPDLKAVQMLLAAKEDGADYAAMSDEQLNAERERLLATLREEESGGDRKGAAVEVGITARKDDKGKEEEARKDEAASENAAPKGAEERKTGGRSARSLENAEDNTGGTGKAARKKNEVAKKSGTGEEADGKAAASENAAPKAIKKRAAPRKKRRAIKRRNI